MASNCIFCKIASGNNPSTTLLYSDESVVAFDDISPAAEHHFLVIPKKHIKNINEFKKDDVELGIVILFLSKRIK
ncbi:hypothetical protein Glove_22g215 [Diversispora epigaea]|uniref:HIT domain-containing protein n=1 Tax=Diversispora epigaea TaxID=1348612 RepID=A0A397JTT0_9GLOM|nr:hypothetical protein Glove_22g215 [Diversispora epigaea]